MCVCVRGQKKDYRQREEKGAQSDERGEGSNTLPTWRVLWHFLSLKQGTLGFADDRECHLSDE